MPKPLKIKLSVPEPCKQGWDEMTPHNIGRYCANCCKSVVDFSNFTDSELVRFLSEKKEGGCGRFTPYQLDRVIAIQKPNSAPSYQKMLLAASVAALVTGVAKGQTPNTVTISGTTNASGMIQHSVSTETEKKVTTGKQVNTISGTITDAKTKFPMPYSSVVVSFSGVFDTLVYADSTGFYTLEVPSSTEGKKAIVTASGMDYLDKKKFITPKKGNNKLDFRIKKDPNAKYIVGRWAMKF